MQAHEIETNGITVHVRVGGYGPAVVMVHGFGTTGDMWGHLANALIEDHTIVAPDLRGLGLSSKPDGGYDKKNQALPSVRPRCGRQQDVPCAGQASDASLGLGWRSHIRPYDRRRDAVCCRQRRRCDHSGLRDWITEEQPQAMTKLVVDFLRRAS
jgi:pimeloyl-ACP methyl ester carboxylesterase